MPIPSLTQPLWVELAPGVLAYVAVQIGAIDHARRVAGKEGARLQVAVGQQAARRPKQGKPEEAQDESGFGSVHRMRDGGKQRRCMTVWQKVTRVANKTLPRQGFPCSSFHVQGKRRLGQRRMKRKAPNGSQAQRRRLATQDVEYRKDAPASLRSLERLVRPRVVRGRPTRMP